MGLDGGYGIGSLKPGVCTSTTRPASPFVGQTIYMTDTEETAVWEGEYWEGLNRSRDRNVVINGAMQVAQRGTSAAGLTGVGYSTADRFRLVITTMGTWTETVENDAPTGSGFRKSLKVNCTTADASPGAADVVFIDQSFEGQNLQQFCKGTADAKQFTLSFYVKASLTGTYIAQLFTAARSVSAAYTVVASNTWEEKTITFPADTTGEIDNNNLFGLGMRFWLATGTDNSSGTLNTTWNNTVSANRAVGQVNLAGATSRTWQVTGVQLEAGAVATPFEFEDFGTTLGKCQRYFEKSFVQSQAPVNNPTTKAGFLLAQSQTTVPYLNFPTVRFAVVKRATPTLLLFNPGSGTAGRACDANNLTQGFPVTDSQGQIGNSKSESSFCISVNNISLNGVDIVIHWAADSEL